MLPNLPVTVLGSIIKTKSWRYDPLLYINSDHTNVNVWGSVATASAYFYIIAASHWPVLLSPLTLPLTFIARAIGTAPKKYDSLTIFRGNLFRGASNTITDFVRAGHPLRLNIVSLDTWHSNQETDEADNPPRMA